MTASPAASDGCTKVWTADVRHQCQHGGTVNHHRNGWHVCGCGATTPIVTTHQVA